MSKAFRYGGDEMLALIPGGTGETAEKMIKTWKQTLAAVQVAVSYTHLDVYKRQHQARSFTPDFTVKNPNCAAIFFA